MNKMMLSFSVAAGALMVVAGTSQAQINVYTSQAAFNAASASPGVDTFDDVALALISSPTGRSAGSYTYTASAATGLYGAGAGADHWLSNNTATDAMVFNGFGGAVYAAGGFFFTSNIAGLFAAGDINITATDTNANTVTYGVTGSTTGSFVGFVSSLPLVSISISSVQPGTGPVWPTANDFTLAVPTPGAAAMLGLGGLTALRRRR